MFSVAQKRAISEAIQEILRKTGHPELPEGEITFQLHVEGSQEWSWADIENNGAITQPGVNLHNELQGFDPVKDFTAFVQKVYDDRKTIMRTPKRYMRIEDPVLCSNCPFDSTHYKCKRGFTRGNPANYLTEQEFHDHIRPYDCRKSDVFEILEESNKTTYGGRGYGKTKGRCKR